MLTRVQRYLFELLAPRKYRRMVNRKLEDAARADRYADEQRDNSDLRSFRSVLHP